jgi:hypothetical protein
LVGNEYLPESSHKWEIREDLKSELALDIGQLILDITGILDPTPISDGTNALLSLARGRWFDAAINAVSIVPYLGDLAKTAKLPHYLETIHKAVRIAGTDRKWAAALRKLFLKLKIVLDKGLKAAAGKLPDAARRQLTALKKEVDDFLLPGGGGRRIPSKADLYGGADTAGSSSKLSSGPNASPSGVDSVARSPSQLFGDASAGSGVSRSSSAMGGGGRRMSQSPSQSSTRTPSDTRSNASTKAEPTPETPPKEKSGSNSDPGKGPKKSNDPDNESKKANDTSNGPKTTIDPIPPEEPYFNPIGTAGAARVWTKAARIKHAQLPSTGKVRYVPPKNWHASEPLPRGANGGYIDKFGNEWTRGPSRTQGQAFEWDVQLGKNATPGMKSVSPDGRHVNVSLDGRVTH